MKFKVGDRVRIKSWEQMEKEFGKNSDGGIDCIACKCGFNSEMRHLCGRTATISEINDYKVKLTDWSDDTGGLYWTISTDMIELVDTSKLSKSDLQEGDIVTDREGNKSIFLDDELYGTTIDLDGLTDELKDDKDYSEYDIVKVERPIKYETVFERKEVREMTVEEISKALGFEVKVVK